MTLPGIYSQRDPRWANDELGYNTDPGFNMYHYGCLVTAFSNMLWYIGNGDANPGWLNQHLKATGGFEPDGGIMRWGAAEEVDQAIVSQGFSYDLNAVNSFLQDDDSFAILQLTKPGFPMHFSLAPFVGMIADSWDGVLKPISSYNFVGAHLYRFAPHFPPAPIPQPPAPAPLPPMPELVPSTTEPIADPSKTGQPSGEVPVQTAPLPLSPNIADARPESVLRDLPEWELTYIPDPTTAYTVRDGVANDMEGSKPLINVPAGTRVEIAGHFESNGINYVRTQTAVANNWWYGLPVEVFFNTDNPQDSEDTIKPRGIGFFKLLALLISPVLKAIQALTNRSTT